MACSNAFSSFVYQIVKPVGLCCQRDAESDADNSNDSSFHSLSFLFYALYALYALYAFYALSSIIRAPCPLDSEFIKLYLPSKDKQLNRRLDSMTSHVGRDFQVEMVLIPVGW